MSTRESAGDHSDASQRIAVGGEGIGGLAGTLAGSGVLLGQSFQSLTGQLLPTRCLQAESTSAPVDQLLRQNYAQGRTTIASVEIVESLATLRERLAVAVSATAKLGVGSASGSFTSEVSRSFSRRNANLLVEIDVTGPSVVLARTPARSEAMRHALVEHDYQRFTNLCGTHFVSSLQPGGRLQILVTVTAADESDARRIEARLAGKAPFGSGKGTFVSEFEDATSGQTVSLRMLRAGTRDDLPVVRSIESLLEYAQSFPGRELEASGIVRSFEVTDYASIVGFDWPEWRDKLFEHEDKLSQIQLLLDSALERRGSLSARAGYALQEARYDSLRIQLSRSIATVDARIRRLERVRSQCALELRLCGIPEMDLLPAIPAITEEVVLSPVPPTNCMDGLERRLLVQRPGGQAAYLELQWDGPQRLKTVLRPLEDDRPAFKIANHGESVEILDDRGSIFVGSEKMGTMRARWVVGRAASPAPGSPLDEKDALLFANAQGEPLLAYIRSCPDLPSDMAFSVRRAPR